jgi:hypothetical protein
MNWYYPLWRGDGQGKKTEMNNDKYDARCKVTLTFQAGYEIHSA